MNSPHILSNISEFERVFLPKFIFSRLKLSNVRVGTSCTSWQIGDFVNISTVWFVSNDSVHWPGEGLICLMVGEFYGEIGEKREMDRLQGDHHGHFCLK